MCAWSYVGKPPQVKERQMYLYFKTLNCEAPTTKHVSHCQGDAVVEAVTLRDVLPGILQVALSITLWTGVHMQGLARMC